MSNQINDGGPAFPMNASTGDPRDGVYCQNGMSLRDWFAGQALAGLLSEPKYTPEMPHRYAKASYIMADAMLKARGGGR
jgi:hypothetical protein